MSTRSVSVAQLTACTLLTALLACGGQGDDAMSGARTEGESRIWSRYAEQAAAAERDPCTLVTREELERIRDGELYDGERDDEECFYAAKRKDGRIGMHFVKIAVATSGGREAVQAWRDGSRIMNDAVRASTGMEGAQEHSLAGLGDEALIVATGIMDFLVVRKGDAYVKIEASGPHEQMVEIARLAIGRL